MGLSRILQRGRGTGTRLVRNHRGLRDGNGNGNEFHHEVAAKITNTLESLLRFNNAGLPGPAWVFFPNKANTCCTIERMNE
mmetsp:Transcript_11148/g.26272  ORF Transcript_11148/g.26272 Transcript_11148/m.26272 type:complete len:81 (-) Transcript_11148:708-950(-)